MRTCVIMDHDCEREVDVIEALHKALSPDSMAWPDPDRLIPPLAELLKRVRDRVATQTEIAFTEMARQLLQHGDVPAKEQWRELFKRGGSGFPLSQSEIDLIVGWIRKLGQSIAHEQFGYTLPLTTLHQLRSLGLIKPDVIPLGMTAFEMGLLGSALYRAPNFQAALELAKQKPPAPEQAMAASLLHAQGAYHVKLLSDRTAGIAGDVLHRRNVELGRVAGAIGPDSSVSRSDVNSILAHGYDGRLHWKSVAAELRNMSKDFYRDWDRIAYSELQENKQTGRALEIATSSPEGFDTVIYRIPRQGACRICIDLFLNSDGTPKEFTIRELMENGSNVGRVAPLSSGRSTSGSRPVMSGPRAGEDAEEMKAVIGQVHPYCGCETVEALRPKEIYDMEMTPEERSHYERILGAVSVRTVGA